MQSNVKNFGRTQKDIYYFITYGICFIALGLTVTALGPMLPYLAENVGVSFAQISFLFTTGSLGYLIGSAGGGRLYDRFKGHHLLILSLILMVFTVILIPLTTTFSLLLVILFLLGLGQGLLDIGGNVNLLWVFQKRVGPYMNALHFFFGVGAFLSPIILHNVYRWSGEQLHWPFWSLAILSLPGIAALVFLTSPENPEREAIENHPKDINTPLVVAMVFLFFLYVGVEGGFGGWIFTYATEGHIATEAGASYMNAVFWGALTLGRLISVPLAKKLSPAQLLTGNYLLAILFLGLILIFPMQTTVVWIVSAGLGLALSSVFPTLLVLGESRMKISGKVTGLFFLGSSLGGTLVPMVLGQIFEYIGSYYIMLALFFVSILGLVVLSSVIIKSNRIAEKIR